MDCKSEAASHYAGCACHEERRQNEVARLERERDEARERAAGLSRELLGAMQARDSYRMSAERRVGMRREVEEILGCGDTMGDNAFGRGLARLRELVEAESRAARLEAALRDIKALKFENNNLALTVKALTPAANYCLEYKPLLLKAERERDAAVAEAERLTGLVQGWYEGRARIGAHMTFVDQRFYDSVRCERTGWPGDDADGDGGPPEE